MRGVHLCHLPQVYPRQEKLHAEFIPWVFTEMPPSLPAPFISHQMMRKYPISPSRAKAQPCRSCTARCAWGRWGARRPRSFPRLLPSAAGPGGGTGGCTEAAAAFPLLLAPSRGPPQKVHLRLPRGRRRGSPPPSPAAARRSSPAAPGTGGKRSCGLGCGTRPGASFGLQGKIQ